MSLVQSALELVRGLPETPGGVVSGFDGFVDEMITPVAERQSLEAFTPVPDIGTFGALISAAAGHSSLREVVVNAVHPGGCAVNMGDGLAALGVPVDCFATLGEPAHPAFAGTTARFRSVYSWGREPGRTLAFEFADGKLMFSSVRQLAEFTAEDIRERLADGTYAAACANAPVIALTDWTLYPHMTGVWRMLVGEVYSKLTHRPHFFFDLVDPSSRSARDIHDMLQTLPLFEAHGPVTLGLNGNEANILARLTGIAVGSETSESALALAAGLREALGISGVVIHRNHFAVASAGREEGGIAGPHCPNPRKSTGAGDRFNAGYVLGLLGGGAPGVCAALGCASAGFFVRRASSATRAELCSFLEGWRDGTLE